MYFTNFVSAFHGYDKCGFRFQNAYQICHILPVLLRPDVLPHKLTISSAGEPIQYNTPIIIAEMRPLKVNIHISWVNKMHNVLEQMLMFLFLFFSMLLLCSFFRLKELFQVKNGLTAPLLFLFLFGKCLKFGSIGRH